MARRYTAEALSRVLSEHAAGRLKRGGHELLTWRFGGRICGCANEVAFNALKGDPKGPDVTFDINPRVGNWFDANYRRNMTPEELLAGIEEADRAR